MHLILILLFLATVLVVRQFLNLKYNFTINTKFFGKVKTLIKDGRTQEAYQQCLTTSHPLSKVLASILYNSNRGSEAITSASNIEIQKVLPYIKGSTSYVQLCGHVSMLLGLLGTIQGLIQGLTVLNTLVQNEKEQILSTALSTALNTSAFGFVVAIPCIILFTVISNREDSILKKYDEIIAEVTHLILFKPQLETVNEDPDNPQKEYRKYGT